MNKIYFIAFFFFIMYSCGEVSTRKKIPEQTHTKDTREKLPEQTQSDIEIEKYQPVIFDSIKLTKFGFDTLRLIRNEIFAKRGLIFKSKDLQEYFNKYDWYLPKYHNVTSLLSNIDKENVKLVRNIENLKIERLNYLKDLPNMHDEDNMYDFVQVDFDDYPYWNISIPNKNEPHIKICVNGKKEFSNCIFISYYTYECGPDGGVPPVLTYNFEIDVYNLNGLLVNSNVFYGEDLVNYVIKEDKIHYYLQIYKSMYSEAEKDSSYYDELHVDEAGIKEKVYFLDANNMAVKEMKKVIIKDNKSWQQNIKLIRAKQEYESS